MSIRLRVLLMTPDYPPARGGIQYLLQGLVRHATRLEFRVVAFGDESSTVEEEGVRVRRVSSRGAASSTTLILSALAVAEARAWRPDVVLAGHIVNAPAARVLGVPYVQYLHAKEVAHRPRLARFAVRHAAAIIAVSAHTRSLALSAGAPAERIRVIPPGIDLPEQAATTPRDRGPSIVTVARLHDRYKGFEVLVRALPLIRSRVPIASMTFVGGGHLRSSLEALARANGCGDALHCVGGISDADRDELLAAATVFAMPSRLPTLSGGEGFGIVYLEAAAHGTPVVAGNVGGAVDAVVHGETGLLIDPEDHIAVAEAISSLLLDRELATRLGSAGREWTKKFAWPNIVSRVEDVLIDAAAM